jgi:hypothetical protein
LSVVPISVRGVGMAATKIRALVDLTPGAVVSNRRHGFVGGVRVSMLQPKRFPSAGCLEGI